MGGSIVMEDPLVLAGLFHRHPILKWMRTGGTPIPGTLHIYIEWEGYGRMQSAHGYFGVST
jgi:hypothetical protein